MFDRLEVLCSSYTDNLADLAELAAPGDAAFFNGAEFRGADLRCTDLSRFALVKATFIGAKIDHTTKMPDDIPLASYDREDGSISIAIGKIQELIVRFFDNVNPLISSLQSKSIRHSDAGSIRSVKPKKFNFNHFRNEYRAESNAVLTLAVINKTIFDVLKNKDTFSSSALSVTIIRLEEVVGICDRFARFATSYSGRKKDTALPNHQLFSDEMRAANSSIDVTSGVNSKDNSSVSERKINIDLHNLFRVILSYKIDYLSLETADIWSEIRDEYIKTVKDLKILRSSLGID